MRLRLRRIVGLVTLAFAGTAQADPVATLEELLEEKRYDEVQAVGEALLEQFAEQPVVTGAILDRMVLAASRAGRAPESEVQAMARRAVETKEAAKAAPVDLATSLYQLGMILAGAGQLDEALEQHRRALAIRDEFLPDDDVQHARSANETADVLRRLGRYDEATPLFERALRIREAAHGPRHPEVAKVLQNMGNNLLRSGEYVAARDAYHRALAIKEEALGPDDASLAYTLISQGVLGRIMGDYDASRRAYERAIAIADAELGSEHALTLAALNNLGNLLNETGDYASALPVYERTLAAREKRLGPDHPEVAETHLNLGILRARMGDVGRARASFEEAVAIWSASLGPTHPHVANALESMAHLELDHGDVDAALDDYTRGREIRERSLGPAHPETGKSYLLVASAHLAKGSRAEALQEAVRAAETIDRHLRETIAHVPERQALSLVSTQIRAESVLFTGLLGSTTDREAWADACWNWTLRRRGLVQEELARRHRRVHEDTSQAARRAWGELAEARVRLGELWVVGPGDGPSAFAESLRAARERKERAETDLARVSTAFATRRAMQSVGVDDVKGALGASEALVEIVRVDLAPPHVPESRTRDIALLMDSTGPTAVVDLGDSRVLDALTQSWRHAVAEAELALSRPWETESAHARLREASKQLRRAVWDPLAATLEGVETLYLVPDGAFHLIDLYALELDDGRFLVEVGPQIRWLDSGRDLALYAASVARRLDEPTILAVGDVNFDERAASVGTTGDGTRNVALYRGVSASCDVFRQTRWSPLSQSMQEVEAVEAAFDASRVRRLAGTHATEECFKEEAAGNDVLHIATHGFFLNDRCAGAETNPLLLSGLVFAGANQREVSETQDDGILTAEEVGALDLRNVELAVLSACDTGRGEVAVGEGVFGLRRAFHVAGVSTVVMSLWPTPDAAAQGWMAQFYSGLGQGRSIAQSARDASLARLEQLRAQRLPTHPQHWCGFIAAGDWR